LVWVVKETDFLTQKHIKDHEFPTEKEAWDFCLKSDKRKLSSHRRTVLLAPVKKR